MDLEFSKEDITFRDEVRTFIDASLDDETKRKLSLSKNGYIDKASHKSWHQALYKKGWVAPNWPIEYGGPGWTPAQKFIFEMETARAGTPGLSAFGLRMVGPVIMKFGTEEQKADHLPKILSTERWWCQGYSEPGAGSDLASLQMKAEDKGDHYLLNGSKIWTTTAQWADWIFCLVRTSNEGKRQEGISFVLVDMTTPGVEVQPIITLDGPAENLQEINQVFFSDVKVPKENRIGKENEGWTYAKYLLEFERGGGAAAPGLYKALRKIQRIAANEPASGGALIEDLSFKQKISDIETQIAALEFTELRMFAALSTGQNPGPESSILKTRSSEMQQEICALAMEAIGNYAFPFIRNTFEQTNEGTPGPDYAAPASAYYFNVRKASIYAGSNEIQRNIMAKAVLGL
jgi:alkylation response protein AidB-like acyl-CoA dehydrogenase